MIMSAHDKGVFCVNRESVCCFEEGLSAVDGIEECDVFYVEEGLCVLEQIPRVIFFHGDDECFGHVEYIFSQSCVLGVQIMICEVLEINFDNELEDEKEGYEAEENHLFIFCDFHE